MQQRCTCRQRLSVALFEPCEKIAARFIRNCEEHVCLSGHFNQEYLMFNDRQDRQTELLICSLILACLIDCRRACQCLPAFFWAGTESSEWVSESSFASCAAQRLNRVCTHVCTYIQYYIHVHSVRMFSGFKLKRMQSSSSYCRRKDSLVPLY
jgi:hypothetical protein